jgi:D-threo-aldose 1-dehydrogenase
VCRRWSEVTGRDLMKGEVLGQLMLKASLEMNPASVILFSSKQPAHIVANVRVAEDASMAAPARRLYDLVQAEGGELTGGGVR